ncbi:SDR family oxidoreductase [Tabrizicola sp. J26]|jgi:NAD(P)-dependent dehydrogenase (short-subunit alcohol dehydrogenase family)|uniref:SDR family oxidoreductase n=1 Tax=Alitabrizicola rongguiensis TaxID=2909234 RepID=UPI001F417D96|nr:SDR family oxidoreductase [Tabrizicola rongguiensis]MCF1710585.1 SDR family oxidoreductase [Tabrizicola rongguiensis]
MKDKVVVITGASRGIGAAAARVFADAGAKVALVARSNTAITDLAAEIGPAALALPCDIAEWSQVEAATARVMDWAGQIDVLINNAGVIEPIARLAEADPEAVARSYRINLLGVFHGMRAVLPVMRRQGSGTILTVSSGAAHNPYEGWGAYCSGKAGAAMLTRAAHLEEAPAGIRVMGLSPGTVATEMQVIIKASGVNPVSQLDPSVHIPAEWPARTLLWMCGSEADPWLGKEISLRDEAIRRAVGLI